MPSFFSGNKVGENGGDGFFVFDAASSLADFKHAFHQIALKNAFLGSTFALKNLEIFQVDALGFSLGYTVGERIFG